ncbi:DUF6055 domain-containing protein [Bacteroides reticulotermitis]|uniref:DUF6055 domain-containing protein n=1 Tax=Bacteroides reticulotermitis TaxID=1133319 RepID=UPI003A86576E
MKQTLRKYSSKVSMKTRFISFKSLFPLLALCLTVQMSACSDNEEVVNPEITVGEGQKEVNVVWNEVETSVKFEATTNWTATVKDPAGEACNWLKLNKYQGTGGHISIPILFESNDSEIYRTAVITLLCGDKSTTINIIQGANPNAVLVMNESDIKDFNKYYKPGEFNNINMLRSDAKWSWFRHKQSEHFFVFWEPGFGEDPNGEAVNAALRVDIDDLLERAEEFYKTNVEVLKFANVGSGKSYLDTYKMEIYLLYQSEWLATGSGYDNKIGALWVNPSTCQPVGSTIAHEIGHSFQYQVYCDKLLNGAVDDSRQGFRYGFAADASGGNSFWEQCAQWQSFQDYPDQLFGYHVTVWKANYHRHFNHEWMRYASYWLQYYWAQKHGVDVVGEVWKQSKFPEDPLMTYQRLYCNNSLEALYTELYDYATRMVTYDIDVMRNYATEDARNYTTKLYDNAGYYQVAYASCPGTSGFNIIPLNVVDAGTTIKANFVGLAAGSSLAADDAGNMIDGDGKTVGSTDTYNKTSNTSAGWRYGFVAVVNGKAQYAPMHKADTETVSYTIPTGTSHLYFVVLGAPTQYATHPWNDTEADDDQWPYKVKFEGTDLLGSFYIDTNADPKSETFTYNLTCSASTAGYELGTINLYSTGDIKKLAQAFVMKPDVLSGRTLDIANETTVTPAEGKVALGLLQSDNTYSYTYSANGGFYCTAQGDRGTWGADAPIWFEYNKDSFVITYGHKPGKSVDGQRYTIKPVLVYVKNGTQYKATFVINLQF